MANYMFLYMYIGGENAPQTKESQDEMMKAWSDWLTSLGSAVVEVGTPFKPGGKIVAGGGVVRDEPPTAMTTGYSIVSADSPEQAIKLAQSCPGIGKGIEVTVLESVSMG